MARRFLSGIDLVNQLVTAIGAQMSTGKLWVAPPPAAVASRDQHRQRPIAERRHAERHRRRWRRPDPLRRVREHRITQRDRAGRCADGDGCELHEHRRGHRRQGHRRTTRSGAGWDGVWGNKRGAYAVDWQRFRADPLQVASGDKSVIAGGDQNRATALYSAVGGGSANRASGQASAVLGGDSNQSFSAYSFIGGGQSNTAQTSTHATVCGGNSNTASGQYAFVGGGNGNFATGSRSIVAGGDNNLANSSYSSIPGGAYGTTRSIQGYFVFPACIGPIDFATGVSQSGLLVLGRQTTDATATVLRSNNSTASSINQVTLPNNSAYSFSGEVIAGRTGGGDTARWTIAGAIKRGASAATTTMVGTPTVTMTHNDAGAAARTVAVTADTTNGGIKVEVTGAASTTIRWVCRINTVEVTY